MSSGLYPPSSRTTRLRLRPAASAIFRPVADDPVKLIRRTLGFSANSAPIVEPSPWACGTTLSTPAGSPASSKISAQRSPPTNGADGEGFETTVLPATNGVAIDRADRIRAAFQG